MKQKPVKPRGKTPPPSRGRRTPGKSTRARLAAQLRDQARDAYKASILEAAERIFVERGYFEAKVADIAREAGLAAGTLYNYFDSKEHIYEALCEWRHDQAFAELKALAGADTPPMARLEAMVRWIFEHIEANEASFRLVVEVGGEMADFAAMRKGQERLQARQRAHLELFAAIVDAAQRRGELRGDVPAQELTYAVIGIMKIYMQAHMMGLATGKTRLAQRAPLVLDLFLKGAAPR